MAFNNFIILVLALSSLLSFYVEAEFAPASSPEQDNESTLLKICRGCQYSVDCCDYIAPHLTLGEEINSVTLHQAGLRVLSAELQKAIDQTHNSLLEAKSDEVKQILGQCLETYSAVVQLNERTKGVVATQQYGSMETDPIRMESKLTETRETLLDKKKSIPELEKLAVVNGNVYVIAKNNVGIALDVTKPQYHN